MAVCTYACKIPPDHRYQTFRGWYWGVACHVLGYERRYHRQHV